jgi:hypothetical protein
MTQYNMLHCRCITVCACAGMQALALMTSESSSSSSATPVINNARAFQLQGLVHHDYGQYAKAVKVCFVIFIS